MTNESTFPPKHPQAILDYLFDWSNWLAAGEEIDTVTFTISPGLSKQSQQSTISQAVVWVSGGEDDQTYNIECKIVTTGGRTEIRSRRLPVKER